MSSLRWLGVLVALTVALGVATAESPKPMPLAEADVLKLIELQIDDDCIIARLDRGGLGFKVDGALLKRLTKAGASADVVAALRRLSGEKVVADLPDDPAKASVMVWVTPHYDQACPLHSEMRINGELVNRFSSRSQQAIGKYLKMGWNTLTLKTTLVDPGKEGWNSLTFAIGPTRKMNDKQVMTNLWEFNNSTDWSYKEGRMKHRSGADVKDVTLTFRLFFAAMKHEAGKVKDGDYLLTHSQHYVNYTPPFTTTLVVNGTTVTTWLGGARTQLVLTPLLKKGKNEIRVISKGVPRCLEWNSQDFVISGPAEYSPKTEKFLLKNVLDIKGRAGWVQDKKTAEWSVDGKPGVDTVERVTTFYLDEEPKSK